MVCEKGLYSDIGPVMSTIASLGYSNPLLALADSHGKGALSITAKPLSRLVTPELVVVGGPMMPGYALPSGLYIGCIVSSTWMIRVFSPGATSSNRA
ncbi:MAG: hypothetical protein BWY92_01107 [Firmicutes bacterium ADurb.BinA052]|nr:MAG: hypothetical protein BWY92_01107 [Firmicutes bacterium ADurb.BinA052]